MSQNIKFWKVSLNLLLGLFALLYIFSSTVTELYFLFNDPVAGITFREDTKNEQLVVAGLVSKGPAYKAGIQVGDRLIQINDFKINNFDDHERASKDIEIGSPVNLLFERNGKQEWVSFTPGARIKVYTRLIFTSLLPGIIFCYSLCLIGLFVFLKRLGDPIAHIFYLMVLFWALAMWGVFSKTQALLKIIPLWLAWINLLFFPLAVGLLVHFSLIFPFKKKTYLKYKPFYLFLCYGSVLMAPWGAFAHIINSLWMSRLVNIGYGVWFSIGFFTAFTMLGYSANCAPTPFMRDQAKLIYRSTAITLGAPIGLHFIPRTIFNFNLPYTEYILLIAVLWPMSLAYAIIKHRLMDVNVIIKRGVAYALMSGIVVAAYFVLVIGSGKLLLILTGSTNEFITIISTLLIAVSFNPVKNRIQRFVDRRFFPTRFLYRDAIRNFNHKLVNVVDLEKLQNLMQSFLFDEMQLSPVVQVWQDAHSKKMQITESSGLTSHPSLELPAESIVLTHLKNNLQLLDFSLLKQELKSEIEPELEIWEALQTEIILPLHTKGDLKGLISLGGKTDQDSFYNDDINLLQTLNDQLNISLANALLTEELREQDRLKKELEVARRIQLSSLPAADPEIPGLDITGVSIPALEVGGDYYDYLEFKDGRIGVVVGDVSGKGTSAALYMSQLKGILQTAAKFYKSLKDLMIEVNSIAYSSIEVKSFITLTCGAFDPLKKKLFYVRAGHVPLIHYSKKHGKCSELTPKGIGIGLENGVVFNRELEEFVINFASGDVFVFCSDGVSEAHNPQGEEFELRSLMKIVETNDTTSASELREKIITSVLKFSGNNGQQDDMTLVVVKVK